MQAKLGKLQPLGKQTKKIVTGYMNEGFEFWRHLFAKSVRYNCDYIHVAGRLYGGLPSA